MRSIYVAWGALRALFLSGRSLIRADSQANGLAILGAAAAADEREADAGVADAGY